VNERSRQVLALYREARVKDQLDYYAAASAEYERASSQSLAVAAVLLSVTTLAGALAGLDITGKIGWAIAAAVLPALSTVLAAYEALFGFDRVGKLFTDAIRSLHGLEPPDVTSAADDAVDSAEIAKYAAAVEAVLRTEQSQWGQLTAKLEVLARNETQD
jgi:SMODS and SLOG-associating 2TM effector domain 1